MKEQTYTDIRGILEHITDGYIALDDQWIVTHMNTRAEELLKISKAEMIGQHYWSMVPDAEDLKFYNECHNVLSTGCPSKLEEFYEPWGKWFQIDIYPSETGLAIFIRDTTNQKRFDIIHRRTEEISGVAGWELDVNTQRVFMTQKAYEIYGFEHAVEFTLEMNKQIFDDEALEIIDKHVNAMIGDRVPVEYELTLKTLEGEKKQIKITGFPLIEDDTVRKLYGTIEDITEKKQKEKERQETLEKLETAQNIAQLGYWNHDIPLNRSEWSDMAYKIWGQDPDRFTPNFENWLSTIHPDDRKNLNHDFGQVFKDKKIHEVEHRIVTADGKVKWVFERITLHRTETGQPVMLEGIVQDITQKKEQETKTLQALREKETLLAEIHHRVKNNLAIISGLMHLQAYEEESEVVQQKLLESISRIISMASIHEQLYQSNSFSKLDYATNLNSLVRNVIETIKGETDIELHFDLDSVELNVNQAIPLSLLINEVVTNILKHAFKGVNNGRIEFHLTAIEDRVKITVTDNGVGLPDDFEISESSTLGIRLIEILSQQLSADFNFDSSDEGTVFTIEFKKLEVKGPSSTILS